MAKGRKHNIDFTGVEAFNKPAEGTHKVKIYKTEETTSQGGNDMFKIYFEVVAGESKGCKCIENYPLVNTALWKLKSLLQAVGMKADGRVQVDLDKLEGKILTIDVGYEDYEGQERARVLETRKYIAPKSEPDDEEEEEDFDADDEEEEEPEEQPIKEEKKSKKKSESKKEKKTEKKSKKKTEPEPEPEDDEDDDWDDDDWDDED